MKHYIEYMSRQSASPALHDRLLALEAPTPMSAKRPLSRRAWPALAACCVLVLGLALWHGRSTPAAPIPMPDPTFFALPDRGTPPTDSTGVTTPPSDGLPEETPIPTPAPDAASKDGTAEPILPDTAFTVPAMGKEGELALFAIPAVNYADVTGAPAILGDRLKYPDDGFDRALTQTQILSVLWGGTSPVDEVPWGLFWDGYSVWGSASYDGSGALYQATLSGTHPDGRSFHICLAPDAIPTDCVYPDAAPGTWAGTAYEAWSRRAEGGTVYSVQLLREGVGVLASFSTPDSYEGDACLHSTLFLRWCCTDSGLSLEPIAHTDHIPAMAHHIFASYADALAETDFVPYLPTFEPSGFTFADGELRYREDDLHALWLRWERGYDNVTVNVDFLEDPTDDYDRTPVDIQNPEAWDLRLYTIPWCDSVPAQYQQTVSNPTFRAEDISYDVLLARQSALDTGGDWYHFYVLYPNGVLVRWSISGLTPEAAWALVEPTL